MMSAWRLVRDLVISNKLTSAVIAALTLVGLFSGGIALANHLAPVTSPPGEAGHVLVVMYNDINVLDAKGHTLGTRSCSDPNKSDYRVVQHGWDVVVLSNSFVTIQGDPYYLVAYPDPCQLYWDFSSNQDITKAIKQAQSGQEIDAAAVGYVAADRLSEATAATPEGIAPEGSDVAPDRGLWQECWVPTCSEVHVHTTNTTLPSATGGVLYAWWTGTYVDPHWWHVQTRPGATQVAVYGRDWSAIATDKPAAPAPAFAYVIRFVGYSPIAYDEHTAFTSTSVTLENDGDRSWQASHPDTADDLRLCPGNPPGPFQNCTALDGTYGSTISGGRIAAEMSGQMDWPASHSAKMCVDSHVADASTGWQDVYAAFVQPSSSCFYVSQPAVSQPAVSQPSAPAQPTPTPTATDQPQPAPPVVAPPAPVPPTPTPTATDQPPAPYQPTWHTALSEAAPSCTPNASNPAIEHWYAPLPQAPYTACTSEGFLQQQANAANSTYNYGETDLRNFANYPTYDQSNFQTSVVATFLNPSDTATYAALIVQTPRASNLLGGYIFSVNTQGCWELHFVDTHGAFYPVDQPQWSCVGASSSQQITVQVQAQTLTAYLNGNPNPVVSTPDTLGTTNSEEMGIMTEKTGAQYSSTVAYTNFNLSFYY